ncbi:MAG: hypothetical protein IID41_15555 [Planctomycetes bacterium]|nr:hypothetical protein [Planctomycetota bacterium]
MDTTYYSLEALAAALALPKTWLKDEADAGHIPCLMVNARRRFDLQAVRDALAEQAATATVPSGTEEGPTHAT